MIALINSIMLDYPILSNILPLFLLAITSYLSFKITRKFLIRLIASQIKKSKTKLDDILIKNHLFLRISYLVPLLIIDNFSYIINTNLLLSNDSGKLDNQNYETIYFSDHKDSVDLTKILLEILIIEIPFKKLCTNPCKGLCPVCGINLNYKLCSCSN